jgi:hemoglobin
MKQDIASRTDIEQVINSFYGKAKTDAGIGFFFTEVVPVNWSKHLPVMYDFWEHIVFNTGSYNGNPMPLHAALHKKHPMTTAHFNRWVELFTGTVDDLYQGPNATLMKQRATSIATIMQAKIFS